MPPFQPRDITDRAPYFSSFVTASDDDGTSPCQNPNQSWLPILEHDCDFSSQVFVDVMTNLIRNPNLNSTHLFRADIWYDSLEGSSSQTVHQEVEHSVSTAKDLNKPQEKRHDTKATDPPTDEVHSLDLSSTKLNLSQSEESKDGRPSHSSDQHPSSPPDRKPRKIHVPGYSLQRTLVREMIPRNPQLDRPLLQTCHLFRSIDGDWDGDDGDDHHLVVYLPHASDPDNIPWYHPAVCGLAFFYKSRGATTTNDCSSESPQSHGHINQNQKQGENVKATISIHYSLFPTQHPPLSTRLVRTATQLLSTLAKHGRGTASGYVKRVQHDLLIPQARLQNTYSRLKLAHARRLIDGWVEQTDPSKHVFEDLGIAAFLIELWRDMYDCCPASEADSSSSGADKDADQPGAVVERTKFPGFVDIGCGNGVLVDILLREGYEGWGFDARSRRTWDVLGEKTSQKLKEYVLVPGIINPGLSSSNTNTNSNSVSNSNEQNNTNQTALEHEEEGGGGGGGGGEGEDTVPFHNGTFPAGTFIISNHADELTPWTPLLGALSGSPFLIIPCCSHDLSGAKFRAPAVHALAAQKASSASSTDQNNNKKQNHTQNQNQKQKQPNPQQQQPSTYASLVAWVEHIAHDAGYIVEREMLRIPSTRNVALIGRKFRYSQETVAVSPPADGCESARHERQGPVTGMRQKVQSPQTILFREGGADGWVERAMALRKGKIRSH
ncbi:DUF1613-domain-containing protein [Xylona heveae TC161]|uniref:tRNA (uracil-O(2)-)-methyltransferase n=1 Tax=Xylona heveae (strain CBS 132557 / TC161) TaxID=1328760 RepID=A0A165FFJ7_XYLHT|nr:DUF1613-domain-containing protein [Xylona heveae TC161]KZF20918.1 DUF1613-domain-containing protein [Xylona heveae TC161]